MQLPGDHHTKTLEPTVRASQGWIIVTKRLPLEEAYRISIIDFTFLQNTRLNYSILCTIVRVQGLSSSRQRPHKHATYVM